MRQPPSGRRRPGRSRRPAPTWHVPARWRASRRSAAHREPRRRQQTSSRQMRIIIPRAALYKNTGRADRALVHNRAVATRSPLDNRAPTRRYLQPDFRCLCCKRRSSWASARTRYLQRCLRRTRSDVAHVTCVYPFLAAALSVSRLTRTVRRRHVTAAESLITGTFSMGTSYNRRYAW